MNQLNGMERKEEEEAERTETHGPYEAIGWADTTIMLSVCMLYVCMYGCVYA